jgi:hypothetical protein
LIGGESERRKIVIVSGFPRQGAIAMFDVPCPQR